MGQELFNVTKSSLLGCEVNAPKQQTAPLVFSSPHSGRHYPADFVATSKLDTIVLRRSEDAFVDEIFAAAPDFGAPLLHALFPRAYVDANREAYELDPTMFKGPLPKHIRTKSPRITAGLGTIPRVVADGIEIYQGKIEYENALSRIENFYRNYHQTLDRLIKLTVGDFGAAILIDCHSMPSFGAPGVTSRTLENVDIVLGDNHSTSCTTEITDAAEDTLAAMGYRVKRNSPYAGGYITRYYGQPQKGVHALQIEINRALYMDELNIQRDTGLSNLIRDMKQLIHAFVEIAPAIINAHAKSISHAAE